MKGSVMIIIICILTTVHLYSIVVFSLAVIDLTNFDFIFQHKTHTLITLSLFTYYWSNQSTFNWAINQHLKMMTFVPFYGVEREKKKYVSTYVVLYDNISNTINGIGIITIFMVTNALLIFEFYVYCCEACHFNRLRRESHSTNIRKILSRL